MRNFSYLIYFIQIFVFCHASLPKFPQRLMELPQFKGKYTGKIVGGQTVDKCSSFPYQVSIQRKSIMSAAGYSHFCGGSIVDSRHIITAGHCVNGRSPSALSVVLGTHKLDSAGREGIRINVERVIVHENYNARDVDYDIAVLKLEKELTLSECSTPVKLPQQDQHFEEGHETFVTGWGTTTEGGSTSSTLQVVGVPIVTMEACRESYGEEDITDRMICAGLPEGGKDSCQGDSGGPLVDRSNTLVGIVSWGYGCARPDYFGVYTRVPFFANWVRDAISVK